MAIISLLFELGWCGEDFTVNQANMTTSSMKLFADLSWKNTGPLELNASDENVECCALRCAELAWSSLLVWIVSNSMSAD